MKKILSGIITAVLISTSAMALEGTVNKIVTKADGSVKITIGVQAKGIAVDAAGKKEMIALALTAQSTGTNVEAFHDGTNWQFIAIKPLLP